MKPTHIMRLLLAASMALGSSGCAVPEYDTAVAVPRTRVARTKPRATPLVGRPRKSVARAARLQGLTIIVDAGHGGHDRGARGVSSVPEKAVNLSIAMKVARTLRRGRANVITTRTRDRFVTLEDRAALADKSHADLFVSIHSDSAPNRNATGATVYIAENASARSRRAGKRIEAALRRAGIKTRGVRRAGFHVLVGHTRPAVLVECGYLTNRGEARRLGNDAYRTKVANAIADGISKHFQR